MERKRNIDWLDDALTEEPNYKLSVDFTDNLMEKINSHISWRECWFEFFCWMAAIVGTVVAAIGVLYFINIETLMSKIEWCVANKGVCISILLLTSIILLFDRVLLNYYSSFIDDRV